MTNNKYVLAAALSLTTLGAAIVSTPVASAQRPAIIKNIDEKGRTPFQKTLPCASSSSGFCSSIFPPVPANKRLVVEYVNAFFSSPAGANPSVILTAQVNTETSFYFLPSLSSPNMYTANTFTLAYFEAADSPEILIFGVGSTGQVTLSGYFVDLSQ